MGRERIQRRQGQHSDRHPRDLDPDATRAYHLCRAVVRHAVGLRGAGLRTRWFCEGCMTELAIGLAQQIVCASGRGCARHGGHTLAPSRRHTRAAWATRRVGDATGGQRAAWMRNGSRGLFDRSAGTTRSALCLVYDRPRPLGAVRNATMTPVPALMGHSDRHSKTPQAARRP